MLWPESSGGPLEQNAIEMANIPWYLGAPTWHHLPAILDYADWDTISFDEPVLQADRTWRVRVSQDYPMRMPFHRAFYPLDFVPLSGEAYIDNHYQRYLDDMGW